ncbi:MAG: c-type cytochrome biogenesis protein CcsB [Deltaproteobacteria bacterium]|nr:c-type cytochrome biogenesis protein CcsB [Deltaproteobacteria bacterium]
MSSIILDIAVLLYLASTGVYTAFFFTRKDRLLTTAQYILIGGFIVNSAAVLARWIEAGRIPATTLHESLALFAFITVSLYIIALFRYKQRVLGAFVAPFALIISIIAVFMPRGIAPLSPALVSYWLPVHILIAIAGNAFFALAFFLSVMYVIQERHLKQRNFKGLFFVMPSLETLDELNYRCLQIGFPLLTLAIVSGAIWSQNAVGSYWLWKPRQIWSLITWFLYAALLHGRLTAGWRGRKAAIFSGIAFATLVGAFILINLLLGGAHGLAR